jgi:uncharacterized alpha-E superfamily protein
LTRWRRGGWRFVITHSAFSTLDPVQRRSFDAALHHISGSHQNEVRQRSRALIGGASLDLDYVTIGDIFKFGLHEYLEQIQERLVEINNAMHATYCATSAPEILPTD